MDADKRDVAGYAMPTFPEYGMKQTSEVPRFQRLTNDTALDHCRVRSGAAGGGPVEP